MNSKYNIFLQARLSSTRMPKKVVKQLKGKPVIQHIVERLNLLGPDYHVVVAIPQNSHDVLSSVLNPLRCSIFVGSEKNVLERFYQASQAYPGSLIIRATADNLFVDLEHVVLCVNKHIEHGNDLTHCQNLPLGTGVEVISYEALKISYENATKSYQFEHVTPYVYENKDKLKVKSIFARGIYNNPDIRLTLDEQLDWQLISRIFDEFYDGINDIKLTDIIEYLVQHPEVREINASVVQKAIRE